MDDKAKPLITTVCVANYCRSPVAKVILENKYGDKYRFDSAGLAPMAESNMDQRSLTFLKSKGYKTTIHVPKSITSNLIKSSTYVYAMDIKILMELNRSFPRDRSKFKLINFQKSSINIQDPYLFENNEYQIVMENINEVCSDLIL